MRRNRGRHACDGAAFAERPSMLCITRSVPVPFVFNYLQTNWLCVVSSGLVPSARARPDQGQSWGLLPFVFSLEGRSPSSAPGRHAGRDILMLALVR
jgi:hypothetical protein